MFAFRASELKSTIGVCQIGLGKPLWARVFRACCCNSDNCVRYCDSSLSKPPYVISVATAITASGIVTDYFQHNRKFDVQLQE